MWLAYLSRSSFLTKSSPFFFDGGLCLVWSLEAMLSKNLISLSSISFCTSTSHTSHLSRWSGSKFLFPIKQESKEAYISLPIVHLFKQTSASPNIYLHHPNDAAPSRLICPGPVQSHEIPETSTSAPRPVRWDRMLQGRKRQVDPAGASVSCCQITPVASITAARLICKCARETAVRLISRCQWEVCSE